MDPIRHRTGRFRRPRAIAVGLVALATTAAGRAPVSSSTIHPNAGQLPAPSWRVVGGGPVSLGGVLCTQIRIAPDGTPHLAYQDYTAPSHRVAVRRLDHGAWSPLTLQGAGSTGEAWYNRMAFQHDGALVVATRDYGLGGRLGVRRCVSPGAPWRTLGGTPASVLDAHYTDVAVLLDDRIAVAFQDRATTPPDRTSVVVWDGTTWSTISGPGLSQGVSGYSSLDVARDGTLFAGFTDATYGGRATVRAWDPDSEHWRAVGPPGFTPDVPNNLVVRSASGGTAHVAYYVWNSRIVVRRFDGSAWPTLGPDVDGGDVPTVETEGWRQWLGFEIDAQGRPVVAYEAANLGRRAVVKRFDPVFGVWETLGAAGFTPSTADYLSLALGPDGTPYVAFRDGVTGRALVMAWR